MTLLDALRPAAKTRTEAPDTDPLRTLKRSEQIQLRLLEVAEATLQRAKEVNRKIPGAPIFPSAPSPAPTAP